MLQCLKKVTLQLDLHFGNRTRSQQGKYDKYSRLEIKFVLVQGKKPMNFQLALCWHRMVVWHILDLWSILNDRMLLVSLRAWNSVSRLGKGGLFNWKLHGHSRRPSLWISYDPLHKIKNLIFAGCTSLRFSFYSIFPYPFLALMFWAMRLFF